MGMAVTAAFWVWSIEAQVYTLGFLGLAWATYMLIEGRSPNKYLWVGMLHGLAILGHIMHVLWIVPALYWMQRDVKPLAPRVKPYLISLAATTILPYWIVIQGVVAPGRNHAHLMLWIRGSAGLTPDRSWGWHSAGLAGPWIWLKSTLAVYWGTFWPYGHASPMAVRRGR